MIARERRDWLEAAGRCCPDARWSELLPILEKLDQASERGRWEIGVSSRGLGRLVALRYFGEREEFGRWSPAARQALGRKPREGAAAPPLEGLPWLTLVWDSSADKLEEATFLSGARGWACRGPSQAAQAVAVKPGPFSRRALGSAELWSAFSAFARLCPVRDCLAEFSVGASGKLHPGRSWALRLKEPLPFPRFLRLDLSAPFTPQSSQLALLALDRRVRELAFAGEDLWAYFGA